MMKTFLRKGDKPNEFSKLSLRLFGRNGVIGASACIIAAIVVIAVIGPVISPYDPLEVSEEEWRQPPTREHIMGTDNFGRDIFSRLLYAARLDLTIGITVSLLSFVIGSLTGAVAGYCGGIADDALMRITDILLSFPAFVMAMGITAMLGTEIRYVILALTIAYIPYFIRVTRSEMLTVRELDYAKAAQCAGNPRFRIILRHLLPNSISTSLVQSSLAVSWAMLDVAGLSFLGLGVQPPAAEWGVMVRDGVSGIIANEWWISFFPGIAITVTALGFQLLGDGLRDLLSPHREKR